MGKITGIKVKITTISNCLIGGAVPSYRIGEIDQCTALDNKGNPIITASSFKGTCRNMFKSEGNIESAKLVYNKYFEYVLEEIKNANIENEEVKKIRLKQIEKIKKEPILCLFGIEGLNHSPKLIFSDFHVEEGNKKDYFSIDHKNTIRESESKLAVEANPRTYKTIRSGIIFKGEILTYRFKEFEKAGVGEKEILKLMEEIKEQLEIFNYGIYRLGNSKSRGYGKIQVNAQLI